MSKSHRQSPRMPATKFPHLRKKLQQQKTPVKRPSVQQNSRGSR